MQTWIITYLSHAQDEHGKLASSAKAQGLLSVRQKLPAFAKRSEFLSALQHCKVVIISGATGCGKSTQMPQYILEQVRPGCIVMEAL